MRIAIIGMGLIGTSLGGALRNASGPESPLGAVEVVGYDQSREATRTARGRLALDRVASTLAEAVAGAQVVVVATPVQTVRAVLADLAVLLSPGVLVTDVASTKGEICAWARELLPAGVAFVGGHPMAGKEQHGPDAADFALFEGAIYCLTPAPDAASQAVTTAEGLVHMVGAKPYYIDPAEHDAYVAGISHLPFLLSTALVEVTSRSPAWREMAPLAASGYRDISRLASGDPVMHRDICLTNRAALLRWVDAMTQVLDEVRTALTDADAARIDDLFTRAHAVRADWLARTPRMRPGEQAVDTMHHVEKRNPFRFRLPNRKRR